MNRVNIPSLQGIRMISSLTGFGRAEVQDETLILSAEIKSVNSRFLEVSTRLSRSLQAFEPELRNLIRARLDRGKVTLHINEKKDPKASAKFSFDEEAASELVSALRELGSANDLNDDLGVGHLVQLKDWLEPSESEKLRAKRLELAKQVTNAVLDDMVAMRTEEGANLAEDLRTNLASITTLVDLVEERAAENRDGQLQKMRDRIEKYVPSDKIDPGRLEQEVAYIIDKIDISEEVVRMRSHIDLFSGTLDKGGSVGKRLNFLLQEMNREVNTMGSKSTFADSTSAVVDSKEALEKMREQVQNIE